MRPRSRAWFVRRHITDGVVHVTNTTRKECVQTTTPRSLDVPAQARYQPRVCHPHPDMVRSGLMLEAIGGRKGPCPQEGGNEYRLVLPVVPLEEAACAGGQEHS
ncbi:hypothetical protein chiPu_0031895, partial [Chiloscyllium punctatum]|nr:hypothetical protein [Chiloscyllium punctatum]